ncbi:hypothetical protein [Rhodopirellula europaea]
MAPSRCFGTKRGVQPSRQTPRRTTSPPPGKTWPTPPRYSLST